MLFVNIPPHPSVFFPVSFMTMSSFPFNSFCLHGVSISVPPRGQVSRKAFIYSLPSVQPKLLHCQNSKLHCSTATNSSINFQSFSASFTPINPNITTKVIFLPLAPSHIPHEKHAFFPLSAFDTILMPFTSLTSFSIFHNSASKSCKSSSATALSALKELL